MVQEIEWIDRHRITLSSAWTVRRIIRDRRQSEQEIRAAYRVARRPSLASLTLSRLSPKDCKPTSRQDARVGNAVADSTSEPTARGLRCDSRTGPTDSLC